MYDVQGVFKVKYFPSVNSMYILAHRRKCMNPECVAIREHAFSQMSKVDVGATVPDKVKLSLELGFYLHTSLGRKDLDNCLKFIIDTLSQYYGFNDNRVYSIKTYKRALVGSEEDLLFYRIKEDVSADQKLDMETLIGKFGVQK